MTLSASKTMILACVLLQASLPRTAAQDHPNNPSSKTMEYKSGQVWKTSRGTTVTILAVEDVRRIGKVVHVRIDNIPLQSCGDVHLTRAIADLAFTEKMMRKSQLDLSKNDADLPESSIDAYRDWQSQKNHPIEKVPLQDAIRRPSDR